MPDADFEANLTAAYGPPPIKKDVKQITRTVAMVLMGCIVLFSIFYALSYSDSSTPPPAARPDQMDSCVAAFNQTGLPADQEFGFLHRCLNQ